MMRFLSPIKYGLKPVPAPEQWLYWCQASGKFWKGNADGSSWSLVGVSGTGNAPHLDGQDLVVKGGVAYTSSNVALKNIYRSAVTNLATWAVTVGSWFSLTVFKPPTGNELFRGTFSGDRCTGFDTSTNSFRNLTTDYIDRVSYKSDSELYGASASFSTLMFSSNQGLTFSALGSAPALSQIIDVANNPVGTILLQGINGAINQRQRIFSTHNNGTTWTLRYTFPVDSYACYGLALRWYTEQNIFFSIQSDGRNVRSADGITWTVGARPATIIQNVAYSPTKIACVDSTGVIKTSTDIGASWSTMPSPPDVSLGSDYIYYLGE